jgi:hypothetical protein
MGLYNQLLTWTIRYWGAISLVLLLVITALSLLPLPELPKVPGSDKTHHFVAYGLLILPAALRLPQYFLWVALGFGVWSGAIELLQPYVNRVSGVFMKSRIFLRRLRRLRRRRKSFNSMLPHEYLVRGELETADIPKLKKRSPVE